MATQQTDNNIPQNSETPGFCSAAVTTRADLLKEIAKCPAKTSDYYYTCNLPKKFEHPHWFNGYGEQAQKVNPLYRTTSGDYGYYAPGYHSVPFDYRPRNQKFTNSLAQFGMYRNYSLNTGQISNELQRRC